MILQIFNIQVNLSTISTNRKKKIKDTSMARLSELAQFYISIICFLIRMLI